MRPRDPESILRSDGKGGRRWNGGTTIHQSKHEGVIIMCLCQESQFGLCAPETRTNKPRSLRPDDKRSREMRAERWNAVTARAAREMICSLSSGCHHQPRFGSRELARSFRGFGALRPKSLVEFRARVLLLLSVCVVENEVQSEKKLENFDVFESFDYVGLYNCNPRRSRPPATWQAGRTKPFLHEMR